MKTMFKTTLLAVMLFSYPVLAADNPEPLTPAGGNTVLAATAVCEPVPACPPVKPVCPPVAKPKWVTVCETEQVEVPTCEVVEEPVEVQVKVMRPVEKEIEVPVKTCVTEVKNVVTKKPVCEEEQYTVTETRKEYVDEVKSRQVTKTRRIPAEKTVGKVVYKRVCDAKGIMRTVRMIVPEVVPTTVKETYVEDETYLVKVPMTVNQPVTKTRKVTKWVEEVKSVQVPTTVTNMEKKTVTVMEPVLESKTVMQKKYVKGTKTVERQVKRRVQVYE